MKIKAIIAIGLVTLALLAGCNKEKESSTTTTKSVTTPAPTQEPLVLINRFISSPVIVLRLPMPSYANIAMELQNIVFTCKAGQLT